MNNQREALGCQPIGQLTNSPRSGPRFSRAGSGIQCKHGDKLPIGELFRGLLEMAREGDRRPRLQTDEVLVAT